MQNEQLMKLPNFRLKFKSLKKPTPKETIRTSKREMKSSQRDLDRELKSLDALEKQTTILVKDLVKKGNMPAAKIQAKELVRIREQKTKLMTMKNKMNAMNTRLTTVNATQTMAKSMGTVTKAMQVSNNALNPAELQQTMENFERQSQKMEMVEEMVEDLFEDEELEEESEEIYAKVLEEISLDANAKMSRVPVTSLGQKAAEKTNNEKELEDLLRGL